MTPLNLLNPAQLKTLKEYMMNLLSGRQATKVLGISTNTFLQAVEEGVLRSSVPKELAAYGPIYRFDEKYLLAVKRLLPKGDRGGRGYKVFTDEVKKKIARINKDKFGE